MDHQAKEVYRDTPDHNTSTETSQIVARLRIARELFEKDERLLTEAQCSERERLCDELQALQIETLYDILDCSMDFISNDWRVRLINGNHYLLRNHLAHNHNSKPIEWGCTASAWLGDHQ